MNAATALTALTSMDSAFRNAVESAAHPSSKPHREATRFFAKRSAEVKKAIVLLSQEREKAWIPVTEKLPDADLLVLIALNDDDVWTGYRDGDIWRYVDAMPITGERVTHWMPMPAPPTRGAA